MTVEKRRVVGGTKGWTGDRGEKCRERALFIQEEVQRLRNNHVRWTGEPQG